MIVIRKDLKEFYLTAGSVFLCHLFLIYFLSIDAALPIDHTKKSKKIVVQTVKLKPAVQSKPVKQAQPTSKQPPSAPIKKEAPIAPTKAATKQVPKETPKKVSPTSTQKIVAKKEIKKTPAKKNDLMKKLLAQAQESLDQIDLKESKPSPSVGKSSAQEITLLSSLEDVSDDGENSYRASLIRQLQNRLQLPDYGEVELSLTIDRSGKFIDIKIISSQSMLNKNYVLEVLPRLTFTSFGSNFKDKKVHSFYITLTNE